MLYTPGDALFPAPRLADSRYVALFDAGYELRSHGVLDDRWWRRGDHIGNLPTALDHYRALQEQIDTARGFLRSEGYAVVNVCASSFVWSVTAAVVIFVCVLSVWSAARWAG